jgi:hypothetical protein
MVETDESLLELLWRIVVQPCENNGQDGRKVLLDGRPENA